MSKRLAPPALAYRAASARLLDACRDAQAAGVHLDLDRAAELAHLRRLDPAAAVAIEGTEGTLQDMIYVLAVRESRHLPPYVILSREAVASLRQNPDLANVLAAAIRRGAAEALRNAGDDRSV
jgi:hypothetical protein